MWYLVGKQHGTKSIYLLSNKNYKIGRQMANNGNDVDIPIDADQTVSRLHAELLIKFGENQCTNLENIPNIILTDNSKFGTFVNDVKVEDFKTLKPNDIIRFGAYNSIYQLCHEPLIVTTSCLTNVNKNIVKKLVARLGGHMINDWTNDCSFVVMDSVTITVKVIDALICQKRIVTKNYFQELIDSSESKKKVPDPANFLPPIGEPNLKSNLIDFGPCENRKTLFSKKKFVFFTDLQLQKLQNIIELASGQCEIFNKSIHLNLKTIKQNSDTFLFIQNSETNLVELNELESKLESLLDSLNLKLIDESEIGLAILYSSLNENCNPYKSDSTNQKNDNICYKIASQTLTDTYYRENYAVDTQSSEINISSLNSQDSLMIQFEKKAEDLFIVTDTPEINRKRHVDDIIANIKPIKSKELDNLKDSLNKNLNDEPKIKSKKLDEDFELLKEDFDFKIDSIKEPVKENNTIKKQNKKIAEITKTNLIESQEIEITGIENMPINQKNKSKENEVSIAKTNISKKIPDSIDNDLSKINKSSINKKDSQKIKNEPKLENKSWYQNTSWSNVVYSKEKPPAESFVNKNSQDESENITPSIQVKIKFEPLIVIKKENDNASTNNGKVNFKKFRKIPKASQISNEKKNEKSTLFKSFKEEPFDINSQFQIFMSSNK